MGTKWDETTEQNASRKLRATYDAIHFYVKELSFIAWEMWKRKTISLHSTTQSHCTFNFYLPQQHASFHLAISSAGVTRCFYYYVVVNAHYYTLLLVESDVDLLRLLHHFPIFISIFIQTCKTLAMYMFTPSFQENEPVQNVIGI